MRYCACGYDRYDDCMQYECCRYKQRKENIMKSENYIVINGKKAELTEEQLKVLGLEREIENPFEEKVNQTYYYITSTGAVDLTKDSALSVRDMQHFKNANYCTDREMMEQRAYAETLNRLLWRYSMEHKGNEIDWDNTWQSKYSIISLHHKWNITAEYDGIGC